MLEARMRLQEAITKPTNTTPNNATSSFKAPRKQLPVTKIAVKAYDPSKDPFAEEARPVQVVSTNPFDNLDDVDEAEERKVLDSNLNQIE